MKPCPIDEPTLRELFGTITAGEQKFTRRMAIYISEIAGIPPMSMVWRLEKMGCLKRGSWDWFKANGGITKVHIEEARGAPLKTQGGEGERT